MNEETVTSTKPKPFCFVLMPFDKSFNDIYEYGIKGACEDAGVYCERVDEQIFMGSMLDRIFNQISRADLLIADMTGRNPNVFYEVGYAHALGKTVVLLTQRSEDIPFDLKHFPHIVYGAQIKELRPELAKRVKHFAFEVKTSAENQLGIELYLGKVPLSSGEAVAYYPADYQPYTKLILCNGSSRTYAPGDFQLGVISPPPFDRHTGYDDDITTTPLPDGNFIHMFSEFGTFFPGACASIAFGIRSSKQELQLRTPSPVNLIIRFFSSAGYRDFPLRMESTSEVR
jgi:hypothetical protein